jgi:choline transport protein
VPCPYILLRAPNRKADVKLLVYHWASVTGGRHGRVCGFFAGYWNFFAWIFGAASTAQIVAAEVVSMYALFHPGLVIERWMVFVTYLIITWGCTLTVLLMNRALPTIETIGGTLILLGFLVTVIVCAVMPHVNDQPYASNASVWGDWDNETGYKSNGLVFCLGMLNGVFAVGTPDVVTHMAEEIPRYVSKPWGAKLFRFSFFSPG